MRFMQIGPHYIKLDDVVAVSQTADPGKFDIGIYLDARAESWVVKCTIQEEADMVMAAMVGAISSLNRCPKCGTVH